MLIRLILAFHQKKIYFIFPTVISKHNNIIRDLLKSYLTIMSLIKGEVALGVL